MNVIVKRQDYIEGNEKETYSSITTSSSSMKLKDVAANLTIIYSGREKLKTTNVRQQHARVPLQSMHHVLSSSM